MTDRRDAATPADPMALFDRRVLRLRRTRAAPLLAGAAFLIERSLVDIAERLSAIQRDFPRVLVLGAYDGRAADILQRHGLERGWQPELLVQMEMSEVLANRCPGLALVGDDEALPIAPESFDLVISPLNLHFANDLPGALVQARRVLKPDGLLLGSMFGGDTLLELRTALLGAEAHERDGAAPRIIPFADVRQVGALMQRAGLALPVADSETVNVRYATALDLMRDLRAMAGTNILNQRSRQALTREILRRCAEIYAERFADPDGRIRASFEIITMTGWAPHASQQVPLRPGSARARLADALGTRERATGEKPPQPDNPGSD